MELCTLTWAHSSAAERTAHNRLAVGSIPTGPTIKNSPFLGYFYSNYISPFLGYFSYTNDSPIHGLFFFS